MSTKVKKVKKPKTKLKQFKAVHQKVKLFRANEPLLSVFMWGINHSVSELSHVPPPVILMPDDFKAYSKTKVDNHCFNKENMPSHFKFKEYCPNVFRNLRERFGVEETDFLRSLSKKQPDVLVGSGRSGARFFVSYDQKFLLKTITPEDVAEIHSVLRQYHEYVVEKHGRTLLPQYLGLYRLTVEGAETYMIVMRHVFGRRYPIHKKFDLKGSTVQRQASEKEKQKPMPTWKDNDFIEQGCKLYLPDDAKEKLIEMLSSDVGFLTKLHLMDYSLLLGIHDVLRCKEEAASGQPVPIVAATAASADEGALSSSPPAGDSSEPDAASLGSNEETSVPTPPDSPLPSTGAFAPLVTDGELDLTDQFYAIPSRLDAPVKEIYFIGLIDILTYYGVKKRTASAAKTVKYGSEAEISTVRPDQYAKRLVEFVQRILSD